MTSNGHCIVHIAGKKLFKRHFGEVEYCTKYHFEKFGVFGSVCDISQDNNISGQLPCVMGHTGRHFSFKADFNEIRQKIKKVLFLKTAIFEIFTNSSVCNTFEDRFYQSAYFLIWKNFLNFEI